MAHHNNDMKQTVTFDSEGLKVVGNLYLPPNAPAGRLPAIIVGHPGGGVKEQAAGLYALRLSEKGYITLAFDSSFHGESEGTPRGQEDPAHRIEDLKCAVSFLSLHDRVDPERIGILGICASGGYVVVAAATDIRIKAVATVSGVDMGPYFRNGANGKQDPAVLAAMLQQAAKARTEAAKTGVMGTFPIFPPDEATAKKLGGNGYEGWEYYTTPRACHERSAKTMPWSSVDKIAGFDGFNYAAAISPRPLLMVVGEEAETRWLSERGYNNAREPKELYFIPRATHVGLYDKPEFVGPAVERLTDYFQKYVPL